MWRNRLLVLLAIFCFCQNSSAQDLLSILEEESPESEYIPPTFNMTRIAFGHASEVRPGNVLEVFISNRFWDLPQLESQSFFADLMSTRFALEYAVSDNFTIGVGATTFDRLYDGFFKYRVVSQQDGAKKFPLTITAFQNFSYDSSAIPDPSIADGFSDRLSFTSQLLISRRVNNKLSLQLSPTVVNRSLGLSADDPKVIFALGAGLRYKVGGHLSVVSEYYARFNTLNSRETFSPLAIGVNWEYGDIMLQFMLTNTWFMVEDAFITRTPYNFNFRNPNLNFGFNATYVIHFRNKLKPSSE